MVYKTISSDAVISKIFRDFKPANSGWIGDAFEWIGEGLEIMGAYTGYIRKPVCLEVVDFKAKLPCDLEQVEAIEFEGHRLPYSNGTNSVANCCINLPIHSSEYCSFNPNYIQTSFATGKIIVHILTLPVDCNGLPMIPDNVLCTTALSWYCISMMCLRGFKHQTIDYKTALMMWEKYYPQAQNDMNFPDIERYEQFKRTWVNVVLNINKQSEFFNDSLGNSNRRIESGTITSMVTI